MANAIWNEKEKRWELRVTKDGKTKKFTSVKSGRPGKLEVNRKRNSWESNEFDQENARLDKCWQLFLDMIIDRRGKDSETYVQNEMYGRLHILPLLGKHKAKSITLDEWQRVISTARPHGKTRKNGTVYFQTKELSKKSLINLKGAILLFCKFAKLRHMIDEIPSDLYIPAGAPTIGKTILQPDQVKRFLEPSEEWYINCLRFEVFTGLRPGEVLGLKKEDYKDGVITIHRALNNRNRETTGKNKNARRTMVLQQLAISEIEEQLTKSKHLESEWIFCNRFGGPGTQHGAYMGWRRIAAERNLSGSPYSFRHTFISLSRGKLSKQGIQDYVGHAASMDTFRIYGHEVDGEMKETAKILDITFKRYLEQKTQ
ncbi:MAG: site-specific integrase [Eubacteriales bacterium]